MFWNAFWNFLTPPYAPYGNFWFFLIKVCQKAFHQIVNTLIPIAFHPLLMCISDFSYTENYSSIRIFHIQKIFPCLNFSRLWKYINKANFQINPSLMLLEYRKQSQKFYNSCRVFCFSPAKNNQIKKKLVFWNNILQKLRFYIM